MERDLDTFFREQEEYKASLPKVSEGRLTELVPFVGIAVRKRRREKFLKENLLFYLREGSYRNVMEAYDKAYSKTESRMGLGDVYLLIYNATLTAIPTVLLINKLIE